MWFEWGCAMGPALWPQRWELLYSHPIGMKVRVQHITITLGDLTFIHLRELVLKLKI